MRCRLEPSLRQYQMSLGAMRFARRSTEKPVYMAQEHLGISTMHALGRAFELDYLSHPKKEPIPMDRLVKTLARVCASIGGKKTSVEQKLYAYLWLQRLADRQSSQYYYPPAVRVFKAKNIGKDTRQKLLFDFVHHGKPLTEESFITANDLQECVRPEDAFKLVDIFISKKPGTDARKLCMSLFDCIARRYPDTLGGKCAQNATEDFKP